jgi:hypothetical protein
MIRINMLSVERQALNAAIAKTWAALRNRSFSGRNPQLGRMVKCQICGRRHRENWEVGGVKYMCVQQFARPRYHFSVTEIGEIVPTPVDQRPDNEPALYEQNWEIVPTPVDQRPELIANQKTHKGLYGAAAFAKKRLLPHHNRRDLLLVQRTIELYPEHAAYLADPLEAMREARLQAQREIARNLKLRSGKRKRLMKISRNSRKLNQRRAK